MFNYVIFLSFFFCQFLIIFLIQPLVAVPSFICADAFNKFLPFATGFAAGCMIWMVVAELLPDGFKVTLFFYMNLLVCEHAYIFPVCGQISCATFCILMTPTTDKEENLLNVPST